MTIKTLAYSAQQHLEANTGARYKRAHIYELLAASFGFNSYASLCADAVFTEASITSRRAFSNTVVVQNRCIEIGYSPDVAKAASVVLPGFLTEHEIGVIRIADLVAHLRSESEVDSDSEDDEFEDRESVADDRWASTEDLVSPTLLDGLDGAAGKRNPLAHYALALIYAPSDEDDGETVGSEHWYQQAQSGRVLSGVEKEWADAYAANLARSEKYEYHLREAARLGHQDALLDLADQFDDPAFFEQAGDQVNSDPALVADIAERLGRPHDARKWLTAAAEAGDSEAMRQLIEEYDRDDLLRCWTWVYLAELVGADLTKDEYQAIHENGDPYDDDVGGNAFVDGRSGIELAPISAELEADARRTAQEIFQRMA
jgi:TPR repeat protein